MTALTESVSYEACNKLNCAVPSDVILCVANALVATGAPYVEATLELVQCGHDDDGSLLYTHSFTYNAGQLTDPSSPLLSSDVTGAVCRGCLTKYIDWKISQLAP